MHAVCVRWGAMRRLLFRSLFVLGWCAVAGMAAAQTLPNPAPPPASAPSVVANPQTPEEFFARARQLSDLEAGGIPFHLKATISLDKNTGLRETGSYEEWWVTPHMWRKEVTLGTFRYLATADSRRSTMYASQVPAPWQMSVILRSVPFRVSARLTERQRWRREKTKVNHIPVISLTGRPCKAVTSPVKTPTNCGDQYIFTNEGVVRVKKLNGVSTVFNEFRAFGKQSIPTSIETADSVGPIALITVDEIESFNPDAHRLAGLSQIPPGLQLVKGIEPGSFHDGPGMKPPKLLHAVEASLPADMRIRRPFHATAVVATIVDLDGRPRTIHVIQSSGTALDDAAAASVQQYRFTPAQSKGIPVPMEIDVVVQFNLR